MFLLEEDDFFVRRGAAARWVQTGHALIPLAARVPPDDGPDVLREQWVVELRDFPEEPTFALYVDGACAGCLDDWPASFTPLESIPAGGPRALPWWARAIGDGDPAGPEAWPEPSPKIVSMAMPSSMYIMPPASASAASPGSSSTSTTCRSSPNTWKSTSCIRVVGTPRRFP